MITAVMPQQNANAAVNMLTYVQNKLSARTVAFQNSICSITTRAEFIVAAMAKFVVKSSIADSTLLVLQIASKLGVIEFGMNVLARFDP
jgi:hypothetical protein